MPVEQRLDEKQVGGDHYKSMDITVWQAIDSWFTIEERRGFYRGNALKYLARYRKVGNIKDLKKSIHYSEKLVEVEQQLEDKQKQEWKSRGGPVSCTFEVFEKATAEPLLTDPPPEKPVEPPPAIPQEGEWVVAEVGGGDSTGYGIHWSKPVAGTLCWVKGFTNDPSQGAKVSTETLKALATQAAKDLNEHKVLPGNVSTYYSAVLDQIQKNRLHLQDPKEQVAQ